MADNINAQTVRGSQEIEYKTWKIIPRSFTAQEVVAEFKDNLLLAGLGKKTDQERIFEPSPLIQGKFSDPEGSVEPKAIEAIKKALCLLGLLTVDEVKSDGGFKVWGKKMTTALGSFQKVAGIEPGMITTTEGKEVPAPGRVFGRSSAVKLFAALQSVKNGGIWQNAARAAQVQ
ncbi:MAG: hypothetical protein PHH14_00910 [Candidatus Margulisbacteria bacterium]|nr:hypothetical protein [Candidatus Margulisiibacteriota bacterium]